MLELVDNRTAPAVLKVIGVGGGGSNAVNRMVEAGLTGVDFWVANTDSQALERAACPNRIQIGQQTTRGRGAGGNPEIGRLSAEEDHDTLQEIILGADMLFITSGMGGGTGTGAAPVIARLAKELGVLTVAIVTKPFSFEGRKKMTRALDGLAQLRQHVDTLIAIPNQKLMHIVPTGTSFDSALLLADEVLYQSTRGISDLIIGHGIINLDFADVCTVMRDRGNALLGCGFASGAGRAMEAAQAAVSSPLLEELTIDGAQALLVNVQGGASMSFHEAAEAAQFVADRAGDDADVFWGAVVDPTLGDEMRVTIIATGFPQAPDSASYAASDALRAADVLRSAESRRTQVSISGAYDRARSNDAREGAAAPSAMASATPTPVPTPGPAAPGIPANPWGRAGADDWTPVSAPRREEDLFLTPPRTERRVETDLYGEAPTSPTSASGTRSSNAPLSLARPSIVRESRPLVGAAEHSPRAWVRDEATVDGRGAQRDLLDVPTFIRKRMD